jgi:hypothetical protein
MVYLKAYEFWVLDFVWWEEVSTMLDGTASSERGMSMWPCGPFQTYGKDNILYERFKLKTIAQS